MSTYALVTASALYLLIFALLHSYMSADQFKNRMESAMGGLYRYYRLGYNLFNIVLILGFLLVFLPQDQILITWEKPWSIGAMILQILGLAMVFWILFFTFDFAEFAGLKQAFGPDKAESLPPLKSDGPYRICRHPLYLGTLLFVIAFPQLTVIGIVFSLFVFVYGWLGSIPEERKLVDRYGEDYEIYRKRTKKLIPFVL